MKTILRTIRQKKKSNNQQVNDDFNNHYLVSLHTSQPEIKAAFTKSDYDNQTLPA